MFEMLLCRNVADIILGVLEEERKSGSPRSLVWAAKWYTIDWVIYKQQKVISYGSGGWGAQDQGTDRHSI